MGLAAVRRRPKVEICAARTLLHSSAPWLAASGLPPPLAPNATCRSPCPPVQPPAGAHPLPAAGVRGGEAAGGRVRAAVQVVCLPGRAGCLPSRLPPHPGHEVRHPGGPRAGRAQGGLRRPSKPCMACMSHLASLASPHVPKLSAVQAAATPRTPQSPNTPLTPKLTGTSTHGPQARQLSGYPLRKSSIASAAGRLPAVSLLDPALALTCCCWPRPSCRSSLTTRPPARPTSPTGWSYSWPPRLLPWWSTPSSEWPLNRCQLSTAACAPDAASGACLLVSSPPLVRSALPNLPLAPPPPPPPPPPAGSSTWRTTTSCT